MKIAVYGATAAIGITIVAEASSRGADVTGTTRRGTATPRDRDGRALTTDTRTASCPAYMSARPFFSLSTVPLVLNRT